MSLTRHDLETDQAHQLMLNLRQAYFAMRRRCNRICWEQGTNSDQFAMLSVLWQNPDITQQALGQATGYDPATTGAMLRQLENRGWICREPHPLDGRAKLVSLTHRGEALFEELWSKTEPLRQTFMNELNVHDRYALSRTLDSIISMMGTYEQ